jgi:hypothetical protein
MTEALTKVLETLHIDENAQNELAWLRSLFAFARDNNGGASAQSSNPYQAATMYFESQDINPWCVDLIRKHLNRYAEEYARGLRR